jgi:YidC/Oxa1 family membrane protein insertase
LAILEAKYQENKNNPKRKMGGLAGRLQAMQEQQMEMQRKREELERKRKNLGKY